VSSAELRQRLLLTGSATLNEPCDRISVPGASGLRSGGSDDGRLSRPARATVLRVLFGQPDRSFYASELIRDAGTGSGAAQRELARLEESGLIVARRIGNQKHYQANAASPLFSELRNIVMKTVGLAEPLRDALKQVASDVRAAFVYGSVAKATDQAASDIDLMVVSDHLTYGDVFGALDKVSRALGRHVNPTVYSASEFSKRAKNENAFITRVLEGPKVWVIGTENDLPLAS
jgi:predicted nucleotidyltransferase